MSNFMPETKVKSNLNTQNHNGKVPDIESRLEKSSFDAGEKLGEKFGEMVAGAKETAADYAKTSREYVREHPGKSIAIAATSGLLAGALLTYALQRKS
jgi:ElaB/YqjD/DUF883 family membrane-anchored ribosome-binding protein